MNSIANRKLINSAQSGRRSQFVISRRQGPYMLNLYAIDAFWAETRYHPDQNQITGCRAFWSTTALAPYLALFSLPDGLNFDTDSAF
ncbi:MAG: hypothetical protein JWP57_257 [Spirosoma sp.]|nr:hypothetical protein [Spirosoma sp.]